MNQLKKIKTTTLLILIALLSNIAFGQTTWNYISPQPGSKFVQAESKIAIRHGEAIDESSIPSTKVRITGSEQGEINGEITLSADHRTLIVTPARPFLYGETIRFALEPDLKTESGQALPALRFSFEVQATDNTPLLAEYYQRIAQLEAENTGAPSHATKGKAHEQKNDNNYPDNYPIPTVTENDNPAPGYTFVSPNGNRDGSSYGFYNTVIDCYGTPVFYCDWHNETQDYKMHPGNRLAFGERNRQNPATNKYLVMNTHYEIYDTLTMGNGYHVDTHDMLLLENGHYFLMAYDPQPVGMDTVVEGGDPNATVTGLVIQELDENDNVIFQWRSWDHFAITDATHIDFTKSTIDYAHGNAFALDDDGMLLISSRHMNEITKINLETGEIIWRFGPNAKNNMFTFTNDTIGFYYQHDIRRIANGNITLYDNGNHHEPSYSQSLEYALDEENLIATRVWNYINDPVVYGRARGSSQRLDNSNTLISWGITWPICLTETTYEKEKVWEVEWPNNARHYRGLKYNWISDLFVPALDSVDFGTYDDYVEWPKIIPVTNNSTHEIQITSTHNFLACYQVTSPLPLVIPAGETVNFQFQLNPTDEEGQLDDVLTLNYDSFILDTLPQRIARQIFITAYIEDLHAPEWTISPMDGAADVDRESSIEINFNESLAYPDGSTIKSLDLRDMLVFKEIDANGGDVDFTAYLDAWKRKIVLRPNEKLNAGNSYYFELPGGSVADREGHIVDAEIISTFTTIDDELPDIEINPADSTTDVYLNAIITVSFDEAVQKSNGTEITSSDIPSLFNLKIDDANGDSLAVMGMIDEAKSLITIHPVNNLDAFKYYYFEMIPGMLMDMAGNVIEDLQYTHFETGDDLGIDNNTARELHLQPNPTKGNLTISFEQSSQKHIQLFGMNGNKIMDWQTTDKTALIDLSSYKPGVYLMMVHFEDGSSGTQKIIKQ